MGGGEGSAAREAFKRKSIDNIVMCDIDQASDQPFCLQAGTIDKKIEERIEGELIDLDGASLFSTILNKTVSSTLKNETHVYTERMQGSSMAKEVESVFEMLAANLTRRKN